MATEATGRIKSRPATKNLGSNTTGLRNTGLETDRDGFLYVPESFNPKVASPLMVVLHDKGAGSQQAIDLVKAYSDSTGTILLAPESQQTTWDAVSSTSGGMFGEDVFFIDEALSDIFALYRIDAKRIAIAGIGDGATYAVALAKANDDLFTHIVPFSQASGSGAKQAVYTPTADAKENVRNGFAWFLGQ